MLIDGGQSKQWQSQKSMESTHPIFPSFFNTLFYQLLSPYTIRQTALGRLQTFMKLGPGPDQIKLRAAGGPVPLESVTRLVFLNNSLSLISIFSC